MSDSYIELALENVAYSLNENRKLVNRLKVLNPHLESLAIRLNFDRQYTEELLQEIRDKKAKFVKENY